MDDHNANPPSSTLLPASHPEPSKGYPPGDSARQFPTPFRNLVILVSDCELDAVAAAQKIWELAQTYGGRIQFLGLCGDVGQEPSLRRQLVTMSAMVANGNGPVEFKVEFGKSWLELVKENWRTGDVIVCFAEQHIGLLKKPLSQILKTNMNATVHVISGLYPPHSSRPNWLPGAMAWAGSIGIIVCFFWFDVKITQLPQDWAHITLLYLSLLIEVGLIWVWNSLF